MKMDVHQQCLRIAATYTEPDKKSADDLRSSFFIFYLESIVIYWVHAIQTQSMADENQYSSVPPVSSSVPTRRTDTTMGRSENFRIIDHATISGYMHS